MPSNLHSYLLSGVIASGGGPVRDVRMAANFAYLEYVTYSPSALLKLQASHDATGWMDVMLVTGTPTTGTAQVSAYYPYVRGVYQTGWSTTASANMFYAPGILS